MLFYWTSADSSLDAKSKWLSAHNDFVAGINTVGTCMELVDLFAEGSVNLVVADFGQYHAHAEVASEAEGVQGCVSSLSICGSLLYTALFL